MMDTNAEKWRGHTRITIHRAFGKVLYLGGTLLITILQYIIVLLLEAEEAVLARYSSAFGLSSPGSLYRSLHILYQ